MRFFKKIIRSDYFLRFAATAFTAPIAATAPSFAAVTTCLSVLLRTSPAANTPLMLVCICSSVTIKPFASVFN